MSTPATLRIGGPGAGEAPGACDRCGTGRAAYTRKYSGQSLCTGCFRHSISRKVAKTVSKYDMIRDGGRVAVAVSGGKDSLALLQIMHEMSQRHNFEIDVITIDEGIPGYRDEALGIVSDVCGSLGVGHRVYAYKDLFEVSLDEALGMRQPQNRQGARGMSSCSICGTLRRRAIDIAAADVGADAVATGHNLDDMLQTFLINMLSGDTDKIAWMGPGGATGAAAADAGGHSGANPRRIKPFCEIYESEIVFYAFASGLPFQQEPCPHMNEGIRTEIREFLNSLESERSGIKNSMYASVLRIVQMAHGRVATPGLRETGGPDGATTTPATPATPSESTGKRRSSCTRCGASCTGGAGGICSVCETMARLGRICR
ncbi:MAG: adenine nucleotide alpha hydrolase family protein [Nitrosopumilaceae archaeon]|nr:adenine nucleotide alpha hydrolase family protein [Nitrosopumilaceae archaeon]